MGIVRTEEFRLQVLAALISSLVLFHGNAMRIGPGVLATAGPRRGPSGASPAAGVLEFFVLIFLRNIPGGITADAGDLIAKVAIERIEPVGQRNRGRAL